MAQRDDIADLYPLAPLQRGLLFHSLYAPEAAQYFEQLTCRLTGPLDAARFVDAWQAMIDRHPILRSAFVSQSASEPVQVVMKRATLPVQHHDWRDAAAGEQARRFEALLAADQAEGFKLHRAPLMRIALIRTGGDDWQLVVSHHHLLLDGWSLPVLLGELFEVYHAAGRGRPAALPATRPYGDYIAWLGRQDRAAADAFWRATLGDLTEATPLALDLRAAEPTRPADRVITRIARIDDARTEALRALAREHAVTLNTVVQAAWALVLGRHGRSDDVVFGVTMSGRPAELPGADRMVGLFINTLPLRLKIDPDRPIRDWLPEIQRRQNDVQRFDYVSLGDVHGHSGVPRGQPLFRTLYAFENFPLGEALDAVTGDIQIRDARLAEQTNYPLTLVVVPEAGLELKLGYDCDRIPDGLASGMLAQLAHVLDAIAADPSAAPRAIGLSPAPAPRALAPFPGSGPVAAAPSLAAAWRAAVARFPDRIAIGDGADAISYRALDARAAAIAQVLRARGAAPDTMIGVLAARSIDLVAAMLGVVLTGAAYVPLDPRYPTDRVRFMAEDSGCLAVLASTDAAARAGELGCPVIDLATIAASGESRIDDAPARDHAAYVIYTSGSTGQPKGVVVTQDNLLRLFSSTHLWFGFDEHDVWTFFHSFAFDFSVWELWGALLHGGRVVVVGYDTSRDPDAFYALLARERVTVLNQTPSAFAQLMAAEDRRAAPLPLALRTVVFGGEALDPALLAPWFARHGDRTPRLVNMYGITETTVHVTYRPITLADTHAGSVIGPPIPDLEIRLCDAYGHAVPDGVPGEICVAGAGVARGYLRRPELTAERFVADRGSTAPHARLYRSGDLGRRLPDGDLEYLGRIDFQVKIRGFRIELAEIEHALAGHPDVTGALVLAVGDGANRRLAAYLVVRPGAIAPTATELGDHLRRSLPDHMVPELYVALDAFPLTLQGKIDRQALPDPQHARLAAGAGYVAPETPAQAALCKIWQDVLGVARVGIDDDYFALGGDSIRAIRVVALAGKAGVAITLRDLFSATTPRRLADAAGRAPAATTAAAAPAAPAPFALIAEADRAALPADVVDAYPLVRLQAGMLFHSDAPAAARLYHDVFSFQLRLDFDEAAWREAMRRAIAAHPALRTSFHFDGYGEPLQLVHRTIEPPLAIDDLRGLDAAARAARLDAGFEAERRAGYDWATPGLWRVVLRRLTDDTCDLTIACHHAILDGWSLATLMAELAEHYLYVRGRRTSPPTAPDQDAFREFVALERRSEADPASLGFWQAHLADAPVTRISRWPGGARGGAITANRTLAPAVTAALRDHAAAARLPLRTLLLAVHARALALLAGDPDVVTGVVSNGRPETAEGARSLGLFLNTIPLRVQLGAAASWLELARAVQDAERAALPHRRYPMAALRRRHGELFATSFNYVHFHVYEALLTSGDVGLLGSRAEERIDIPFGVTFSTDAATGELRLAVSVDGDAIAPAQAEAAAELYLACAAAFARDPAAAIDALAELPAARLHGGGPARPFAPVHIAVARRAAEAPDAIALQRGDHTLSRAALDRAAAGVAARLLDAGLAAGQPVVLCFERSFALVTAMLGVARAGGAYVPVADDAPPVRLAEILAQLEGPLVLAGAAQAARLPGGARVVVIDEPSEAAPAVAAPAIAIAPAQPAYVLFTSGSTGAQRGVAVPHGALAHHMAWFLDAFPLDASDAILQKTPATFDASVWEFWAALMSGARLCLAAPDGHRDPQYVAAELARGQITVLQLIPSVLDRVLDEPDLGAGALRYLFAGGEALRVATAARATAAWGVPVINLYGPTEATIQCTFDVVTAHDAASVELAALGRPIDGVTVTVRDAALRVVPVGAPGELCVAGPGLALGYWKAPGLTAERFPADPTAPGQRVLRTGDRARLLPDGTLQFLGRLDDQVKVRGTRVEPGEVEARLAALPGVAQAVVAARPSPTGGLRLIAWVELDTATGAELDALRAALATQVADAMMPSAWVAVDHWPRLPSGKIDRRALPAPAAPTSRGAARALQPGAETALAAIWRRVLAVAEVGAGDDFFALGGDSILSMQMVAQARGQGLALAVRDVFARPVLRDLAAWAETQVAARPAAAPAPTEVALTAAQRWFVGLDLPNPRHWNHAVLLALPPEITAAQVARAVAAVLGRRDVFGLRVIRDDRGWRQRVGPPAAAPFEAVDLGAAIDAAAALRDHATAIQTQLDPAAGVPCRAVHYDLGPDRSSRLLVVCHHLIVDGLSWRLLLQDLAVALAGGDAPPPGSFARCAQRLAELADAPALDAELGYWQAQLADLPALPLDHQDHAGNVEASTRGVRVALSAATTRQLLEDAPATLRATPHELLIAGFAHAMAAWTGPRVGFMLESHGRERLADLPDAADAVGWLTAVYPVRIDLPAGGPVPHLQAVKTALRAIPADGSGYGMLRYQRGAAALAGLAEPAIAVNYLGRIDGSFEGTPFARAAEDVGPSLDPAAPRPRAIDVVLHVEDGQLHASWQFCPALHDAATIEALARRFTQAIEALCAETDPRTALTASDFPLARISDDELARVLPADGGLSDVLPLAPVQDGMLFHALRDPERGVYVQQVVAELTGALDRARLERAWLATLAAHPMLRASFVTAGLDRPLQRIHDRVALPIALLDVTHDPAALDRFLDDDRRRGFALDQPPLMRVTVVREAGDRWRLVWTHHHLLLDGWSLPIVFRDFLAAYQDDAPVATRAASGAYAEFLRWLHGRDRDADAAFWRDALHDLPAATLPRGASELATTGTLEARGVIPARLGGELERAARRLRVTVATLFQAAWALVLGRHAGEDDVVFGLTVSGRPDDVPGAQAAVGTYINTLPLRVRLPAHQPIADWLVALRGAQAGVIDHQASALVDVARWAGAAGGTALFEAILVHENYPVNGLARGAGPLAITRVTARESNHYPLSLYVLPGADHDLALSLYYQAPRFTAALADGLLAQLAHVLAQLAQDDDGCRHVGDVTLAPIAEAAGRATFNATARPVERTWPVHQRIRARAEAQPDAIAVIADDATLTYRELGARRDLLARRLAAAGVGPTTPVGICLSRRADIIVAMLAVLDTGGYYVPLDPAFPDPRLAAILGDAAPACVITEPALDHRLQALGARTFQVSGPDAAPLALRPVGPEALAYAIFTSGSTGRPKGVMIPHRAVANIVDSFAAAPGLTADDRLVAVTTLAFDIAALELLLPLVVGAAVVLAGSEAAADPARLSELIARHRATVVQATPATWRMLLAAGSPALRPGFRVWCGGEALPAELAAALLDRGVELWNVYGPTETTIWSTINRVTPGPASTVIGLPIANTTCHVLDAAGHPVPAGVAGELVIGGEGVARGYLGQPALTADRFIPDPLGAPGARLYRTGDLARRHADGRLEVLGRLDFQVKIRGFRVELGDIEAALVELPGIAQAVVVARTPPGGEAQLVAHLVADRRDAGAPPDPAQLRDALRARLPGYMVPSAWRFLAALPLTANQKIDRKALAAWTGDGARADAPRTPPRTPVEQAIAEIWKQVLGITELGVDDGFFERGGHSLAAVRVHARVREVFRIDLPLAELLRQPTVAGLAGLVAAADPERSTKIAAAYLRVLAMSDDDKAKLRARRGGNPT